MVTAKSHVGWTPWKMRVHPNPTYQRLLLYASVPMQQNCFDITSQPNKISALFHLSCTVVVMTEFNPRQHSAACQHLLGEVGCSVVSGLLWVFKWQRWILAKKIRWSNIILHFAREWKGRSNMQLAFLMDCVRTHLPTVCERGITHIYATYTVACVDIMGRWCSSEKNGPLLRPVERQMAKFTVSILYYLVLQRNKDVIANVLWEYCSTSALDCLRYCICSLMQMFDNVQQVGFCYLSYLGIFSASGK